MNKGIDELPSWILFSISVLTFTMLFLMAPFSSIGEQFRDEINAQNALVVFGHYKTYATFVLFAVIGALGLAISILGAACFSVLVDRVKRGPEQP